MVRRKMWTGALGISNHTALEDLPPEAAVRKSIWIGDLIAASLSLFLKILTVMGLHSGIRVQ